MVFKVAYYIATKDLKLLLLRGSGLFQTLLLGLLLLFVFSLAQQVGEKVTPQGASTVFWLASAFSQVLIFNMLYSLEEANNARLGLLMLPCPIQAVLLGKALGAFAMLLIAQLIFLPATIIFLGQEISAFWSYALLTILLVDFGMVMLGSLLGALAQGQAARESLLSIVLFPLFIPLLLAGIRIGAGGFSDVMPEGYTSWMGIVLAFDAMFLGAGLILFEFVYSGDE